MSVFRRRWTPNRVWLTIFGIWLFWLSGALNFWVGGPGLLQWFGLKRLLSQQQALVSEAESQLMALSSEQVRLERSVATQQREIRRVLGYVHPNELIFDFTGGSAAAQVQFDRVARR